MKLCLWDKGNEFWCKFPLNKNVLPVSIFHRLKSRTLVNVNVEIITLNVVILSCPWRNISMIQWLVFLFSRENLQIFRLYINTFHFCPKIETEVADPLSGS